MAGSHELHSYRIYFLGQTGLIVAREDFNASGDECALAIATVLSDVCSDESRGGFELWCGHRRVDVGMRRREPLSRGMQETIVGLEEAIRDSHWAIAKSRRLLEQLAVRKGQV